jgi:hypothetical protein
MCQYACYGGDMLFAFSHPSPTISSLWYFLFFIFLDKIKMLKEERWLRDAWENAL